MDILAARKKAANKAKAQNKPERTEPGPTPDLQAGGQVPVVQPEAASPEKPSVAPDREAPETVMEKPETAPEAPQSSAGDVEAARPVQEIELLAFRLGGEEYTLLVEDVREVLKIVPLTMVPNSPGFILGVMSLRGKVTPIIDLCKRLCLQAGVRDAKSRIIVVSTDEEDVGLVVDRVTGVLRVSPDEIKPAPENVEQGAGYIQGITRKGEKLYILLDMKKAVTLGSEPPQGK